MRKKICFFGASITFGSYDLEGGWVERFRNFFNKNHWAYKVYNLGISGDTTERLLERFENEAKVRRPDIIVLSIGGNDSQFLMDKNDFRVGKKEFVENFNELISIAKKFTNKIVITGLLKVEEKKINAVYKKEKNKYYLNEYLREYDELLEKIVIENNIPFIKLFDLLGDEDLEDGLHPTSEGHEKMFERIKDFLIENKIIEKI